MMAITHRRRRRRRRSRRPPPRRPPPGPLPRRGGTDSPPSEGCPKSGVVKRMKGFLFIIHMQDKCASRGEAAARPGECAAHDKSAFAECGRWTTDVSTSHADACSARHDGVEREIEAAVGRRRRRTAAPPSPKSIVIPTKPASEASGRVEEPERSGARRSQSAD
jgi:hypothetical protein